MSGAPIAIRTLPDLRRWVSGARDTGCRIGLVPTMGALHDGHGALFDRARAESDRVVASIFVNPTQFGEGEDFTAYPRDEDADSAFAGGRGVDALYIPGVETLYPPGDSTRITVSGVSEGLCGDFRPGHFTGVATVVAKLLIQCAPDAAYFGEKDYQQLQVIRRLARDLFLPGEIVAVPTARAADGLALSSRNAYLSAAERQAAPVLYRTLTEAAGRIAAGAPVDETLGWGRRQIEAAGFRKIDYLELRDAASLAPVSRLDAPGRLLAAAFLGRARLIDNVPVLPEAAGG